MIWLYENNLPSATEDPSGMARVLAALSVGGMVLSRAVEDRALADQVREDARVFAISLLQDETFQPGATSH